MNDFTMGLTVWPYPRCRSCDGLLALPDLYTDGMCHFCWWQQRILATCPHTDYAYNPLTNQECCLSCGTPKPYKPAKEVQS